MLVRVHNDRITLALRDCHGRDFIGKSNLRAPGSNWRMELLSIETTLTDPFYAHSVWRAGQPVGIVTSAAFGHRTQQTLALAYIRDPLAIDDLSVEILGQKRPAAILTEAPYDPQNIRMRD